MNKPEMKPVTSSMVQAIGYDETSCTLWVEYNGGKLYTYDGVDHPVWAQMNQPGTSIGQFINKEIKPFHTATKIN